MSALSLTETTRIEQSPRTAARVVEGRALVIVIDDRKLHSLNGVGTRVWELAEGGRTLGEIADALVAEFDVTRDVALADARQFIGELIALGAMRTGAAP